MALKGDESDVVVADNADKRKSRREGEERKDPVKSSAVGPGRVYGIMEKLGKRDPMTSIPAFFSRDNRDREFSGNGATEDTFFFDAVGTGSSSSGEGTAAVVVRPTGSGDGKEENATVVRRCGASEGVAEHGAEKVAGVGKEGEEARGEGKGE